jgi:hypothetical protein
MAAGAGAGAAGAGVGSRPVPVTGGRLDEGEERRAGGCVRCGGRRGLARGIAGDRRGRHGRARSGRQGCGVSVRGRGSAVRWAGRCCWGCCCCCWGAGVAGCCCSASGCGVGRGCVTIRLRGSSWKSRADGGTTGLPLAGGCAAARLPAPQPLSRPRSPPGTCATWRPRASPNSLDPSKPCPTHETRRPQLLRVIRTFARDRKLLPRQRLSRRSEG